MNRPVTSNFKAEALDDLTLQQQAPSIFASCPMLGVSDRYTFVPTARIISGLRELGWVPVKVEEQRIRNERRRGFQKHLIRFRRVEQMQTLDEWNVELVLLNSHDAGCAYQIHAGIFRRLCSNGLVLSDETFEALRFRHAGLQGDAVVQASLQLLRVLPRVSERVAQFRARVLTSTESNAFAAQVLQLRYGSIEHAPIAPGTLLQARRMEDQGLDLWRTMNRCQENLIRGGIADGRRDRRGRLRSVRALRGIDSQVSLNKEVWSLGERWVNGASLTAYEQLTVMQ